MRMVVTLDGLGPEDLRDGDVERLAECVRKTTGANAADIRYEAKDSGGVTGGADPVSSKNSAFRAAETLVRDFLAALEARDLEAAAAMTAPGFQMIFPGPAVFRDFESLLAWAAPRYRWVRKAIECLEGFAATDDSLVVYAFGTLHGEWPSGIPFRGIRFIDRFLIRSEKLVRQDVWNDLSEVCPPQADKRT